jgi:uncharacterized protein (UPF0147 family)
MSELQTFDAMVPRNITRAGEDVGTIIYKGA